MFIEIDNTVNQNLTRYVSKDRDAPALCLSKKNGTILVMSDNYRSI